MEAQDRRSVINRLLAEKEIEFREGVTKMKEFKL